MQYLFIAIVGYLLGCIPSGLIVGRLFCGIDIREYGSKNMGTTNMFRILGAKPAIFVLLADMAKGILAIVFADYLTGGQEGALLLGGIMSIIGHNYPFFLGFKGGRGVATGLGVILILMPKVTGIVFSVWAIIVFFTHYVSLGSVIAAALVPVFAWYFSYPWQYFYFSIVAALFIIIRHKDNIKRLLNGNENKIKQGNMKEFQDKGEKHD